MASAQAPRRGFLLIFSLLVVRALGVWGFLGFLGFSGFLGFLGVLGFRV